jgi:hypothetical protein
MDLKSAVRTSITGSRRRRSLLRLGVGGIVLLALLISIVSLALAVTPTFPDVPATHPYYAAITDLANRGIIGGYGSGLFGPGDPVTRQQFAKMIVLTGGYPVSEGNVCYFTDVEKSDASSLYPDNYVAVCAANGITNGTSATTFNPTGNITRYQVVSMVVRMADNLQPGLLPAPAAGWTATGTWGNNATHGANAARAEYNGLLAGLDLDALSPTGSMSRGEVAQVLHNLLNKLTPATTTTTAAVTTSTTSTSTTTTTTEPPTTSTTSTSTTTSSTTTTTAPASGYYDVDMSPTNVDSSSPAVCSWGRGRLDLFLIDGSGHLRHKWYSSLAWNVGWESLGGTLKMTYPPAAVSWGTNRIDVFACGTNNHLMHLYWNGSAWSSWQDLGGTLTSGPAVCSWAANRLDIFARGASGSCVHKWWDGAWNVGWQDMGGVLQSGSGPAAVSWGSDRIDLFARGTDNALWHKYYNSGVWSASWSSHGGTLTSSPAVASWGSNHLDIFVRGASGELRQLTWNGGWSSWTSRGGDSFVGSPAAVSWGYDRIDVFTLSPLGKIWWMNHYSSAWHP